MEKESLLWRIINKKGYMPHIVFSFTIQFLILASLISFSIDTLPDLSLPIKNALYYFEVFTIFIFTIEYCSRILVAEKKWKFIFSFYGLVDLIAILPFYISMGLDLRSVRAFRFFRLLQVLKLFKYSKALNRFYRAFVIIKEELLLFMFVVVLMLYFSSIGIYYFEHTAQPESFKSVFHSLWWAVTTLTTVGYGDMHPITTGGKVFTFIILMIGLGVVAVPSGLLASALTQARDEDSKK